MKKKELKSFKFKGHNSMTNKKDSNKLKSEQY